MEVWVFVGIMHINAEVLQICIFAREVLAWIHQICHSLHQFSLASFFHCYMTFTLGFLYSSSGEKKLVKNMLAMLYSLCTALSICIHYNFRDCHMHFYAFYGTTFIEKAVFIHVQYLAITMQLMQNSHELQRGHQNGSYTT